MQYISHNCKFCFIKFSLFTMLILFLVSKIVKTKVLPKTGLMDWFIFLFAEVNLHVYFSAGASNKSDQK